MKLTQDTQTSDILKHLKTGESITSLEAFNKFGATRLSAIIFRLRKRGYKIKTDYIKEKNRYGSTVLIGKYYLPKEEDNE